MALFWSKKPKAEKNYAEGAPAAKSAQAKPRKNAGTKAAAKTAKPKAVVAERTTPAIPSGQYSSHTVAIIRPRITEKSGLLAQSNVYTFEVAKSATKGTVAKAIDVLYKVKPTKIAIINVPPRKVFVKGRFGTVSGMKKALVTLKKGDKIDFV